MATLASITNTSLPTNAAPDSYNLTPLLKGKAYSSPLREATVHNTYEKIWALRQGKWLYINGPSGEHSKMPESFKELRGYTDFESAGLLFDMEIDAEQKNNLYDKYPEIIKGMQDVLERYQRQGYSVESRQ